MSLVECTRHQSAVARGGALLCAVLFAAGLLSGKVAAGAEASLESGVIFGTVCALCHEGQCSGRLTFDLGVEGVVDHVGRHAGPLPDASIQELFTLLQWMKRECAYPPLEAPVPENGVWAPSLLARLRAPSRPDYFVPLGTLQPGDYSVEMIFDAAPHVHVEVITRSFDIVLDEPLTIAEGKASARFQISSNVGSFLRLRAHTPIFVKSLRLERH